MNRKAFNRINYGLFLVGSVLDGKYQGCVVNSLHQITSTNPAKFSLSLNKSNETYKAVEAAGSFAATVLERGTPKELVDLFGYKSGRVVDKYEGFQVETDGAGNPYVKDHALARISCKIVDKLDLGSYVLFVCEATEAEVLGEGPAMTLDDYRGEGAPPPRRPRWSGSWRRWPGGAPSAATSPSGRPCPTTTGAPSAGLPKTNS